MALIQQEECADLGATIGPLGGAWLYQRYGPAAPFYANCILLALCAGVLWAFLKPPGSSAPGEGLPASNESTLTTQ